MKPVRTTLAVCLALLAWGMRPAWSQSASCGGDSKRPATLRVLSFNILQGGRNAANVGFPDRDFGGSRFDELAAVIKQSRADIVGVQEDDRGGKLLAALGTGWKRAGSVYSKYDITLLKKADLISACRVKLPGGKSIVVVNCHWNPQRYGPYAVQDRLRKQTIGSDLTAFEKEILKQTDKTTGKRGYRETLNILRPFLQAKETIVLTGDFNEPSHLDWTARAAASGIDRWPGNPTNTPLRFVIRWKGSRLLADAGMRDVYRVAFPDEVKHPGNTWTPPYPKNTPGRRPSADQVVDRIDMVYVSGPGLRVRSAAVVGESKDRADIVFDGRWPTDHRAVLAVFEIVTAK